MTNLAKCVVLHNFAGAPWDGAQPVDSFNCLSPEGPLYGRTYIGGKHDRGTIFLIDNDGSNYSILHNFAGLEFEDGAEPRHDSMYAFEYPRQTFNFYGMTVKGGFRNNDRGTIFYARYLDRFLCAPCHIFEGGADDGSSPHSCLTFWKFPTQPNPGEWTLPIELYGLTELGGDRDKGTLFKYEHVPFGAGKLTVLVSFHNSIGTEPHGGLLAVQDASMLYGMTRHGGEFRKGVVFSFNVKTNKVKVLHDFQGGANDGDTPYHGNLVFGKDRSKLYGTTYSGGTADRGVVFSLNTDDGKDFKVLHSFAGGDSDGALPHGSLTYDKERNMFYGTSYGGPGNNGSVFQIDPDGRHYEVLHFFTGTDGTQPGDNLLIAPYPTANGPVKALYGMTKFGGPGIPDPAHNGDIPLPPAGPGPAGNGTIFAVMAPQELAFS